jgi:hypothetical protein
VFEALPCLSPLTAKDNPMSVRRSHDRRHGTSPRLGRRLSLEQLRAQLGDAGQECVALVLPGIGLGMRCRTPCPRCAELAAEVERLRPEWEAAKAAYRDAHPDKAPKPPS